MALLLAVALANRYLGGDCYDLTCALGKRLGLADDEALGVLWLVVLGVPVLAALVPFVWRALRQRRR